jgi:hypothetical protein
MVIVVGRPIREGINAIRIVVDCLINMRPLVPCMDEVDCTKLGKLYSKDVLQLHGLPKIIILD